jgi:hypothetical protein
MKRYRMLLAPLLALALPLSALADAPESTAQIQTDLRDGQAPGSITPQVMRNFAVSVFDPFPAVVSAAGTTQGTATVLTSQFNIITTCASGAGVMATSYYTKVWNATSNACLVYPISGAQFNSNGPNSPISVPAGGAAEFIMSTTTQGYWH